MAETTKWNGLVIEIQEENPRVFAYFQRWLYTDSIAETGKAKYVLLSFISACQRGIHWVMVCPWLLFRLRLSSMANGGYVSRDVHWSALIGIWLFGDDYSIPEFQDAAMNAMLDKRDIFFRTDKLKYIYQNTEPGSLLRKFFCDKFALTIDLGDKVWFGKHRSEYPSDFLIDVIQQLHCQLSDFDPWLYDDNYMAHHRNRYLLKKAKTPKS